MLKKLFVAAIMSSAVAFAPASAWAHYTGKPHHHHCHYHHHHYH